MTAMARGSRIHVCSHVDAVGELRVVSEDKVRIYRFEFSEMFGPTFIDIKGEPWKRPPSPNGKIWAAFEAWQATSKWARKPEAKA